MKLGLGLVGCGTVGGGVVHLIDRHREDWLAAGWEVEIHAIAVASLHKPRPDLPSTATAKFISDPYQLLHHPQINCIVEVMGGTTIAKDIVLQALAQGTHVITANKALLAHHLSEIEKVCGEHPEVRLGYEAAVCGGIPIIHTLQDALALDPIQRLGGIFNGTTNFMLTEMERHGKDYHQVLQEAQERGYAEADPTADVAGLDVQSKVALLAKLAFGTTFNVTEIPTQGITALTAVDFDYAKLMHSTIKLVGQAIRHKNRVQIFVSPVLVTSDQILASIHGATNLVQVQSEALGESAYVGQGAGRFPTAQSIIADIVQLARGQMPPPFPTAEPPMEMETDFQSRFYVRLRIRDEVGIIQAVGETAKTARVSIYSILQLPIKDPQQVDFVVTTDRAKRSQVLSMCEALQQHAFVLEPPLALPILE